MAYPDIPEMPDVMTETEETPIPSPILISTTTDMDIMDIMDMPQMTQLVHTESPDQGNATRQLTKITRLELPKMTLSH